MKGIILSIVSVTLFLADTGAQEVTPSDSVANKRELQEVVIVSENQRAKAGELTFRPTDREKKASADGYDLLRHMAMPQISVDPVSDKVTTLTGGGVSMFINGLPASGIEVKNLRSANVIRVDYLDFPSDPRYMGAEHVVNFIVKLPEMGGYTRLNNSFSGLNGTSEAANVYTKFIYKKMNYDLYAGWNYNNSHHIEYEYKQYYSLLDNEGKTYWLEQTEKTDYGRVRNQSVPVNFRATYQTERLTVRNSAYFTFSETPEQTTKGFTHLSSSDDIYRFAQFTNQNSRNAGWNGYYNYNTGHGMSFVFNGAADYSNNHHNRLYTSTINTTNPDVINNSKENAWSLAANLWAIKYLTEAHSLGLSYFINYKVNDIDYSGTSAFNSHMKSTNMGATLEYTGNFPCNLRLKTSATFGWDKKVINEHYTKCFVYPSVDVNASYAPTRQHQINFTAKLACNGSSISSYTADILQTTDFMYRTGNPSLTNYPVLNSLLSYVWIHTQKFRISAFGAFNAMFNPVVTVFDRYLDGRAILRSYDNRSHYYLWNAGFNANYSPIRALQLQLTVNYYPQVSGYSKQSIHPVFAYCYATYYLGQFTFSAFGGLANRNLDSMNNSIVRGKGNYGLAIGWNNKQWNARLSASNFFNSSWEDNYTRSVFPVFRQYSTMYTGIYHRNLTVSVSYTFDYGKSVQHGNEIEANKSNISGILME